MSVTMILVWEKKFYYPFLCKVTSSFTTVTMTNTIIPKVTTNYNLNSFKAHITQ